MTYFPTFFTNTVMGTLLFSDLGIDGSSRYQRGDWSKIAIHNETEIRGFFGPYRWLSNFEPCRIRYEGLEYPASENAYKATRALPEFRPLFTTCSPKEAIRLSDSLPRVDIEEWRQTRVATMREILLIKFSENSHLTEKLLSTKNAYLEERLWWRDTFWGYDVNLQQGENTLGRLLMEIRGLVRHKSSRLTFPAHW